MLKDSIHVCHNRQDAHWLTPDPAWSRYSFAIDACIRDEGIDGVRRNPLFDATAGIAAKLVDRVRGARAVRV